MKFFTLVGVLLWLTCNVGQAQNSLGQPHTETIEAASIPHLVMQQMQKMAPDFQEPSWEHYSCQQCAKEGTYSYYKVDFFQEDKPANLTIDAEGKVLAYQLRTKLANLPNPAQQVVSKRASKLQQDFKGVELELYAFTEGDKVLYNVVFYIPTEDKKHWTPFDEINVNGKGSIVKQLH
jgi:hypothetical protein